MLMEMNQHTKQQNLELFKQKVINCLKKNFNYTKEDIEAKHQMTELMVAHLLIKKAKNKRVYYVYK